ncbi:MAG: hypothetical protein AAB482_02825 [Patescibacteria group bacterium]
MRQFATSSGALLARCGATSCESTPTLSQMAYLIWYPTSISSTVSFQTDNKVIVHLEPSEIILALIAAGSMTLDKRQRPVQLERVFAIGANFRKEKVIIASVRGAVVEEVRTIFERKNDATIYMPTLKPFDHKGINALSTV